MNIIGCVSHARLAEVFKALSEPARLRILELLPLTNDCASVYNVSELAEELGIPQPTVSHHLQVLYRAGLVQSARMCRDVYYWIDQPALDAAHAALQGLVAHTPAPPATEEQVP